MSMPEETHDSGLNLQYQTYKRQKCFIGHSHKASWSSDLISACEAVLPKFDLDPWYADDYPDPTKTLRDKVVEMIANARYGIYDLSYWRTDDKSEGVMPRNVLIELGMAIALNRPMLLLRHAENRANGLRLPRPLESVSEQILEFSGEGTLKQVLEKRLPQWVNRPPDQDWWNRYCLFGSRECEYREVYPHARQWGQEMLRCHVSHGPDVDATDFRSIVKEELGRYNDLAFDYLNELPKANGYDFLLCTYCQTARSTPFAIYRITPKTPSETFIAIGMSIALEKQFGYEIPKILVTANVQDVPSLLSGYGVGEAQNDKQRKACLRKFLPIVMQKVRETSWKSRPLPFVGVVPWYVENDGKNELPEEQSNATLNSFEGEPDRAAKTLLGRAQKYQIEGAYQHALKCYKQALSIYNSTNYSKGKSIVYIGMAKVYQARKAYSQALKLYRNALTTFLQLDDIAALVTALNGLADVCREYHENEFPQIEAFYKQLLEQTWPICRAIGGQTSDTTVHAGIANIYNACEKQANDLLFHGDEWLSMDEGGPASMCYEQALYIFRRLDDHGNGIRALLALTNVERNNFSRGYITDLQPLMTLYEQALSIAQEIGDDSQKERIIDQLMRFIRIDFKHAKKATPKEPIIDLLQKMENVLSKVSPQQLQQLWDTLDN